MGNGAVPTYVREDVTGAIAITKYDHLKELHEALERKHEAHIEKYEAHLEDDTKFRAETWKQFSHYNGLKRWVIGVGVGVSAVFWLINHSGLVKVQERVTSTANAQSEQDKKDMDARFQALEKLLKEQREINIRSEDDPPTEPVRRRR